METRGSAPRVAPSEIQTREELAAALTALRTQAGLSVRTLALALKMPPATVGDYCSGRHLPGPGQRALFHAMLELLDVDREELGAWLEAVARVRVGSDARMRRVIVPYQGLAPFEASSHERFFGREAATEEVLERLRAQATGAAARHLVLVVGPSGAGKSSLLRAGVQAQIDAGALRTGERTWAACLLSPGDTPLQTLVARVAELEGHDRVVIIDQLEELFAAPTTGQDRFLDEVERLVDYGTLVLAGLRADFYERAVRIPALLSSLQAGPVLLAPMTEEELRSAIIAPARQAGAQVDEGLVELLIADLAPREATGFAHDAGSLPLLSHALLQSWERAHGNRLTAADYRAAGGLQGAVSQTAEELYTQLTASQQELVRRLFMRLVRMPEDGPVVRRRVRRHELDALGGVDDQQLVDTTDAVIDRFVAARLMTVDTDTVELSHDALLTAWPRLATWVEQNRDGLRLHRQLTDAANDWVAADRDQALLLHGARLQLIGEWAREPDSHALLNADERAFLTASQRLMLQRRRAARRRTRNMRLLIAISLLSAVAAIVLAAVALHARHIATQARDSALSRQIALQATSLAPNEPNVAMQLAVLARRIAPTTDATSALLDMSDGELPTRLTGPTGPAFLSITPNAHRLAVAYSAADRIRIYSLGGAIPRLRATLTIEPTSGQLFAVALSPNGRLLAAGGTAHQVTLWNLTSLAHPVRIATLSLPAGTIYGLAFSPDGRHLAAVNATRSVELWSLNGDRAPRLQPALIAPVKVAFHAVQFASHGDQLVAAGTNGDVTLWRSTAAATHRFTLTVSGAPTFNAVSFSPNGKTLAAGGTDNLVHRWTITGNGAPRARTSLHGFTSWVESLAFSPSGQMLAAGSSDNSLRIWSTAPQAAVLRHPAAVTGVVFASHGRRLITIDSTGTLRVWSMPVPSARSAPSKIFGLDYSADGKELAVISSGVHGDAQLWDTSDPASPSLTASIPTGTFGAVAGAGAISGNGKLLAVANARAQIRLLNISNPHHAHPVGPVLSGAKPDIEQMAFSPTGRLLAAGDDAGHVDLWDTSDPRRPVREPTLNLQAAPQIVLGVAFSPDGHLLAAASTTGQVTLWNVAHPNHPRLLAIAGQLKGYVYSVAFTPNGRTLIAGGADRDVHLWNIADPSHPRPIGNALTGPTSTIYDIAVTQGGKHLAAATTNGSVWLWNIADPASPRRIADLTGATGELYAVSFQPRSDTLVAGGTDRQLHLWDDSPGALAKQICKLAGTPLTHREWAQYVESGRYAPPCG